MTNKKLENKIIQMHTKAERELKKNKELRARNIRRLMKYVESLDWLYGC